MNHSIVQRAKDKGLCEIYVHNLRDYTLDKHRKVDDYAFGFGAGMVLQIEPIDRIITKLTSERHYDEIIFTAPDGERFNQQVANQLSLKQNLIILCGHYKGVDQRVRDHLITKEYTIGDFVLTGGEMPAAIMTDAIVRLLPGALGDETSALSDSFQDGLLEAGPVHPAVGGAEEGDSDGAQARRVRDRLHRRRRGAEAGGLRPPFGARRGHFRH